MDNSNEFFDKNLTDKFFKDYTTLQFVAYVNKTWKKSPESFEQLVKVYLKLTLGCGRVIVQSNAMKKGLVAFKKMQQFSDVLPFLRFKNPKFLDIVKPHLLNFFCGQFLEHFIHKTTPSRVLEWNEWVLDTNIQPFENDIMKVVTFLIRNNEYFPSDAIQKFSDSYVDALFARTKHPKGFVMFDFKTNSWIGQDEQEEFPPRLYEKMMGMYYQDTHNLCMMAKFLARNNGDLSKIKAAFDNLVFEEDLNKETYGILQRPIAYPLYKQEAFFYAFKELTESIIEDANKKTSFLEQGK